jgi:phage gp36-like protein
MKDILVHLEKLRADAAEYALIRDLATDQAKKDYSHASLST